MACMTLLCSQAAVASLVVSYAASPEDQETRLQNTSTMTFDSLPEGVKKNLEFRSGNVLVASYSKIGIRNSNPASAAFNTPYATVSGFVSTITLARHMAYFGLRCTAGEASDVIEFHDTTKTDTLVGRFTTASLMNVLPDTYRPNSGVRPPASSTPGRLAYINFLGQAGTTWNQIRLVSGGSGAFASDNHTFRDLEFSEDDEGSLPGVAFESIDGDVVTSLTAPEPGTTALLMVGAGLIFGFRRRP